VIDGQKVPIQRTRVRVKEKHEVKLVSWVLREAGGGQPGMNPKNATASQGNKYIEWSEEWICPELFAVVN
jgi:hypothetical protein